MKLFIGCDHAAFDEKENLKNYLIELGHEVEDCGTLVNERCDYPNYAKAVAQRVQKGEGKGVLLCGSGIGISIAANRFAGIRAALVRTAKEAELSRQHNDSNIICFGGRINSNEEIKGMMDAWLKADFDGGRHTDRIAIFNDWGEKS